MNQSHNDQLLDRLVDDELSASEREQLLNSFEQTSDGWRRCALAFLEHQAWRHQLKQFVQPSKEEAVRVSDSTAQSPGSSRAGWLALAAGLLLAFSLGWLSHPVSREAGLAKESSEPERSVVQQPLVMEPAPGLDDHDVVTLLVRDDQGEAQRVRVPLVELTDREANADSLVNSLPASFRRRLHRNGMDLRGRRRYAPFYIEQNEQVVPMAVPVDDAYIVPVSRPLL